MAASDVFNASARDLIKAASPESWSRKDKFDLMVLCICTGRSSVEGWSGKPDVLSLCSISARTSPSAAFITSSTSWT